MLESGKLLDSLSKKSITEVLISDFEIYIFYFNIFIICIFSIIYYTYPCFYFVSKFNNTMFVT
jgi:hypothetical protein